MITVTPEAARQMLVSAQQSHCEKLPLRIAVRQLDDGSFHYGMGFEDDPQEDDIRFSCEGIDLVVSPGCAGMLQGTVIDYVELEPGKFHFIFMNPNEPESAPPDESRSSRE